MNRFNLFSRLILSVITFLAFAAFPIARAATEVARINERVITVDEFNKRYSENQRFFQYKTPTKQAVLDDLIKRELGIQEARKLGLDKDPEVIERMNTVLFQALLDKKLSKEFEGINVTDEEAKKHYARNPELRTSHIFVSIPAGAPAADEKKALEKLKKIQELYLAPGKMSFAEVAQKYSEGVAAPMGGDLDFQSRDRLDPAYYEAALGLKKVGSVSGIVRSQFGYHIIKLTGLRTFEDADLASVKRLVFEEKRTAIFEKYMGQLRKSSKVSVNSSALGGG